MGEWPPDQPVVNTKFVLRNLTRARCARIFNPWQCKFGIHFVFGIIFFEMYLLHSKYYFFSKYIYWIQNTLLWIIRFNKYCSFLSLLMADWFDKLFYRFIIYLIKWSRRKEKSPTLILGHSLLPSLFFAL